MSTYPTDFPNDPEILASPGPALLTTLPDLAVIRVAGADARAFLHAQLTRDIEHLPAGQWARAAWCNAKGRVLALFRVLPWGDECFDLILPAELAERVVKRLSMFVLRSRVELSAGADQWALAGVAGTRASTVLADAGCTLPPRGRFTRTGELCVIALAGEPGRFLLLAPPPAMDALQARLAGHVRTGDHREWRLLDILGGEPNVFSATSEQFVPQMLNLHWLDGISFNKGCYPGQEIVARTHYLGQLKRRLYLASASTPETPAPATPIHAAGAEQAIGSVVDAAAHPSGGQRLLAVLRIDAAEAEGLHLGAPDGPGLELLPLPYPTDTE